MRILSTVVIIVLISACTQGGPDTSPNDQPAGNPVHAKRSDKHLILDAVLQDVLNSPRLQDTREFYGTPGDKKVALVTNRHSVPWPADYRPLLPDWTVSRVEEGADHGADKPRLLGIRIDKYSLEEKERDKLFDSPIEVTVLNAGGDKNGRVIGGCSVYYSPKQVGGKWVVEFDGLRDP